MSAPRPSRPYRVLVVDDAYADLQYIERLLTGHGYVVHAADRGDMALRFIAMSPPDIVLLDARMPDHDGFEICRQLKESEETVGIPVMFISSSGQLDDRVRAFAAGAVDYVMKPFHPDEILARIHTHLTLGDMQKQLEERVKLRTAELAATLERLETEAAERARTDKALRESEQRYRSLYDCTPSMYFTVDEGGTVLSVNASGATQLGYAQADLVGSSVLRLFPEDAHDEVRCHVAECFARPNETLEWELRKVRRDGSIVHVREMARTMPTPDGGTVLLIECQDITEQRALQAQFLQAQRMESIGRLAGGVAHDFNNLLTAVLGFASLAEASLPPDHPAQESIVEIAKAGERGASLVRQLLAFARKQLVTTETLDLNELIGESYDMLRRLLGESIELETVLTPRLGSIDGDPSQLQQLLVNLTVNSRDAMPDGGRLIVETSRELIDGDHRDGATALPHGPYAVLTVTDTGTGIDEEARAHLFEPFFTTKGPGKGSGLGLATCHGIVSQMGGAIRVYSEPGLGTTFRILIPEKAGRAASAPPSVEPPPVPSGTETVMVVEDEPSVRHLATLALRAHGYNVLEAANGAEALAMAESTGPQIELLVSDVVMPGMGGAELADRLRRLSPDTKLLLTSGYVETAALPQAGPNGPIVDFLPKPFTPERLARKVREVLDAASCPSASPTATV